MSLADQGSHAVKGEVWSSLQSTISARYILCFRALSGPTSLPPEHAIKYHLLMYLGPAVLLKAGAILWMQYCVEWFQSDIYFSVFPSFVEDKVCVFGGVFLQND